MKKLLLKVVNRLLSEAEVERRKRIFPEGVTIDVSNDLVFGRYHYIQIPSTAIKLVIKPRVIFREFCNILVYQDGELTIEENVFFNNYCSINCLGKITIGENTLFGEGVKLYDHNHLFYSDNNQLTVERKKFKIGTITIGKNCWIGSNVTILNNVEIGDNVIIGANNLIYKSIPANVTVKAKTDLQIDQL